MSGNIVSLDPGTRFWAPQTTRCADLGDGRGNENMKIRAFLTAGLIIAGVTGPSFAFEGMLLSGMAESTRTASSKL